MKVLLDTCTLSEIRNPTGRAEVKRAVLDIPNQDLYLSVITIGEITKGIALLETGKRKKDLLQWVQGLLRDFADSVLPVDCDTARIWGELTANCRKKGKLLPASDGLIAATAMQHGLYVMTRNVADFETTGVMLLNPWDNFL